MARRFPPPSAERTGFLGELNRRGENLFDVDGPMPSADLRAEFLDVGRRLIDFLLPPITLGNDPRERTAMAGDDNRLAALDLDRDPAITVLARRGA